MAKENQAHSFFGWTLKEIAGGALQALVLGSPLWGGGLMGWAANAVSDGSLFWAVMVGVFVAAMLSILLNNLHQIWRRINVAGKFVQSGGTFGYGEIEFKGKNLKGYLVAVPFVNTGDTALQYQVIEERVDVNGTVAQVDEQPGTVGLIPGGGMSSYYSGVAPMDLLKGGNLNANVRLKFKYGRVGHMKHHGEVKIRVTSRTNDEGIPTNSTAIHA